MLPHSAAAFLRLAVVLVLVLIVLIVLIVLVLVVLVLVVLVLVLVIHGRSSVIFFSTAAPHSYLARKIKIYPWL
jgi:hypothetical protein